MTRLRNPDGERTVRAAVAVLSRVSRYIDHVALLKFTVTLTRVALWRARYRTQSDKTLRGAGSDSRAIPRDKTPCGATANGIR